MEHLEQSQLWKFVSKFAQPEIEPGTSTPSAHIVNRCQKLNIILMSNEHKTTVQIDMFPTTNESV